MERSFKFNKQESFARRKKLRDFIIFHRKDSFGMNFRLNVERDFLKLTPLCNVTICTTKTKTAFFKRILVHSTK